MNPKVAIVILNWNRPHDTVECLESLRQIDYDNYEIILVDNASSDESVAYLRAYFTNEFGYTLNFSERIIRGKPVAIACNGNAGTEASDNRGEGRISMQGKNELIFIKNSQNYGFCEGNNIAVDYALTSLGPDYILLLNNDTVVDRLFLNELVHEAERDRHVGLLQPKLLYYDNFIIDNTGVMCDIFAYTQRRGAREKDNGAYDTHKREGFFFASGACVLIRASLLSALSGECFDPHLFAYSEDLDLAWQARLIGFDITYCPTSICHHKVSQTFGKLSPHRAYLVWKNRLRVTLKNYASLTLFFILPMIILLQLVMSLISCIIYANVQYFGSFWRALFWNVFNLRSALKMRTSVQSRRMLSDKEIMKNMVPYSLELRSVLKRNVRPKKSLSDGAEDLRAREAPPAVGCGGGRSVRAESADKRGGDRYRGAPHVQSPPRMTTLNISGSTKQPKKIAIFGPFGAGNFGNEITLQVVLCHLRRMVPNVEFTCICSDPSTVAMTYDIAAVPLRAPGGEYGTRLSPLALLAHKLMVGVPSEPWRLVKSIRMLWGTDALVVPGTGLLTDAYTLFSWGPYDLFRWSIAARLCRCKILFVSVGAGPLYSRAGRFFVKTALSLADFRSYRDEPSLRYLEGIGFRAGNDPVYPDLVFSLPESLVPRGHDGEGRRPVVGLGLMEYAGRYSVERPATSVHSAYLETLVEFTEWLFAHEYDVRLLIGDPPDTHVTQEFKSLLLKKRSVMYREERIIDEPIASVDDLLKQLAATDVVVATRFHNVLLALLLNKPVIAISFHHKCASLMSQMGLSEYCQDIHRLSSVRLIEQFSQLRQSSDDVKRMIMEEVRACRDALDEQYAVILSQICSE